MRICDYNYAQLCGFTDEQYTAMCGFVIVIMRDYADLKLQLYANIRIYK